MQASILKTNYDIYFNIREGDNILFEGSFPIGSQNEMHDIARMTRYILQHHVATVNIIYEEAKEYLPNA